MKRFLCLLLILTLSLTLCGCSSEYDPYGILNGGGQNPVPVPDGGSAEAPSEEAPSGTAEESAANAGAEGEVALSLLPFTYEPAAEDLPPLSTANLQALYSAALTVWMQYSYTDCSGATLDYATTLTNDLGWGYYLCTDYESYAQFRGILSAIFTEDFITRLERLDRIIEGPDGRVYMPECGIGSNIDYLYSDYTVTEHENQIIITVTGYFNENAYDGSRDPAADYTETYDIILVKANGEWRFDSFVTMGDAIRI